MLDVTRLRTLMVADTCAVWNILSSTAIHSQSIAVGCFYSVTDFVLYECLVKPRRSYDAAAEELRQRLRRAREKKQFQNYSLSVDDLLDVDLLEKRQRLSKGELTTIAFARKTRQAIITDDQGARILAAAELGSSVVQTTPQLLGWLAFIGRLVDGDVNAVIEEHKRFGRPLARFFLEMHAEAMRCRLVARGPAVLSDTQGP